MSTSLVASVLRPAPLALQPQGHIVLGKSGRKRKSGRRVNGRLSQAMPEKQARRPIEEQDAMFIARRARERVLGVAKAESGTDQAGWYVGRLLLTGALSEHQYLAARNFAMDYDRYISAMGLPRPPRAVDLNRIGGSPLFVPDEAATRATRDGWDKARAVLTGSTRKLTGPLYAAVYYCVLMDTEMPHFLPALGTALSLLAVHYRIDGPVMRTVVEEAA